MWATRACRQAIDTLPVRLLSRYLAVLLSALVGSAAAPAVLTREWVVTHAARSAAPLLPPLPSAAATQGSNLVAPLGLLLRAGLFDEWLPSTTDR